MAANSTGQTPYGRINDQLGHLIDNARRQATQPSPLRMMDQLDVSGIQTDGQYLVYNVASGNFLPRGPIFPFSLAGSLYPTTSPPFPLPFDCLIDGATFALGTAGTTNTVLTVTCASAGSFTVTIAANQVLGTVTNQNIAMSGTNLLTVAVTTAGTGAADLSGWVGKA